MNPLLAAILASVSDKDAAKVIRELNRIEDAKQDTREPGEEDGEWAFGWEERTAPCPPVEDARKRIYNFSPRISTNRTK